ncbi:hypothetical protein F4804DRAFT_83139 [Jackrogersella minutella]|nr:hypothetical protein F4804DRAFT_83139 [Jackrogersella minutella]
MEITALSADASMTGSLVTTICLNVVAACFVVVRVIDTCGRRNRRLLIDDMLSLLALFLLICYSTLTYTMLYALQKLNKSVLDIGYMIQQDIILTYVSGFTMYFSKTPILVLYLRIFGIKTWVRLITYATLALSSVSFLTSFVVVGAICTHRAEVGDVTLLGKCLMTTIQAGVANGSTAVITDIIIIILPLPIIASLSLPLRKKIGLAIIFLTGVLAIAASVVSLYFKLLSLTGHTTAFIATLFCTVIECSLAIMVGCTPAVRACWSKYAKNT